MTRHKKWESCVGARKFTFMVSRCTGVGLLGVVWEALATALGSISHRLASPLEV